MKRILRKSTALLLTVYDFHDVPAHGLSGAGRLGDPRRAG